MSILLVEDDRLSAEIATDILTGYAVDVASDASQALMLVRSRHYDLALIDLELPDMSGTSLMQLIKDADLPLCLVACTAHRHDDAQVTAASAVADMVLFKEQLIDSLPQLRALTELQ